jgi:hypothetical protein
MSLVKRAKMNKEALMGQLAKMIESNPAMAAR